jgi:hypothetical protein
MNPFSNLSLDQLDDLDPEAMSGPELVLLLEHLNHLYDELQPLETEDEDSDEYLAWEEDLEYLDDLMDDIRDCLEESD